MKKIKLLSSLVAITGLTVGLIPAITSCSCNKGGVTPTPTPTKKIVLTLKIDDKLGTCNKETITLSKATTFAEAMYGVVVTPLSDDNVCEGWKDQSGNLIESTKTISSSMTITASIVGKTQPQTVGYVKYIPTYKDGKLSSFKATWNEDAEEPISAVDITIKNTITVNNTEFPVTEIESMSWVTYTGGFAIKNINSVTIPKNVEVIGENSFAQCTNLTTVAFEQGSKLSTIQYYAFYNCYRLTNIEFPDSLTYISQAAFQECNTALFYVDNNTKYLKQDQKHTNDHFACIGLSKSTGAKTTVIDPKCKILNYVSLDDTVTNLEIPASVISICSGEWNAIQGSQLTTITFASGSKLKYIDGCSFTKSGTGSLKNIKFPDGVELLGNPFVGFKNGDFQFDFGSSSKYKTKIVDGNTILYDELDDGNIEIIAFFSSKDGSQTYAVPKNIEKIANYAFYGSLLKNIEFQEDNKLINVGKHAFAYNQLTKIDFTNWTNLVSIPEYCFSDCRYLTEIIFPTNCKIVSIDGSAFFYAGGETQSGIESVTIPNSISSICMYSFNSAKIKNIVFENPKGKQTGSDWKISYWGGGQVVTETITYDKLTDTTKAAEYLTTDYVYSGSNWSRIIV